MFLAVATAAEAKRSNLVAGGNAVWAWLPVPKMASVLIVVVGTQISSVVRDITLLAPVIPVYIAFWYWLHEWERWDQELPNCQPRQHERLPLAQQLETPWLFCLWH
tara:strand:+ start:440 stop:757 length:318 start_codon:yes stop_codon:yes gene_type:complete